MRSTDLAPGAVAVWTGRFQPPHVGHFAVLRSSVVVLPIPHVVVMVAQSSEKSDGRYGELANAAYADARNPFTIEERLILMRQAVEAYRLTDQVSVVTAPRHDVNWEAVRQFYPPHRVICLTVKDDFEVAKAELWRSRGERVHIFDQFGPADVLTTTEIRNRVTAGEPWQRFIVAACHDYFVSINGPQRLFR